MKETTVDNNRKFLIDEIERGFNRSASAYTHANRLLPEPMTVRRARQVIDKHQKRKDRLRQILENQQRKARADAIMTVRFARTDKEAVRAFKKYRAFKFKLPKSYQ